jgi:hypothetical protein
VKELYDNASLRKRRLACTKVAELPSLFHVRAQEGLDTFAEIWKPTLAS